MDVDELDCRKKVKTKSSDKKVKKTKKLLKYLGKLIYEANEFLTN